jgi:hypothetical protein
VWESLWTGAPPPAELVLYKLTQLFHCVPSQVQEEESMVLMDMLLCAGVEAEVSKRRGNAR